MAGSKNTVSGAYPQESAQPLTIAQTLNVVMETCREQRELIEMLTQKNNQERIVKLSEACYCCKGYNQSCLPNKVILSAVCYCCVGYDRPCLQTPPTIWTSMYNQSFGQNSQSSPILPQVAPKEDNQHMMEFPAQVKSDSDMDISDGNDRAPAAPQDNDPSTLVSTVEKLDTFSETAPCQDASHLLQALRGQIGKRRVPATKDVSTTCRYLKLLQELIRYLLPPRSQ